ncbi:MAG: hypothetical protein OXI83_11765 [Gemmatimonadota bacterium]|nr:hypothetical protein [Gemmatimonadota bacterium]
MRAFQYTAWVRDSSGSESGKIVDWSTGGSGSASAEFTGLASGSYTVWVVMQTVDNSWINIGETSCTVTETATTTTTTTAAPPTTTTAAPSSSPGTLSCSAGTSSVTVSLDAAEGTTAWQSWVEHSSGNPRVGQYLVLDGTAAQLSHEYVGLAQGVWSVSGTAFFGDGTQRALAGISCTVAAPPPTTTVPPPSNSPATGAPTISGTAQVGQTLTASTSGIADADGLTGVTYSYQWLSSRDTEISGATNSTYAVQQSDADKVIRVRVTFTDDAGNEETLTSAATSAVVVGGL